MFEDPWNPTPVEIRRWAHSDTDPPEQDWELAIDRYPSLLIELIDDPSGAANARCFLLRALYVYAGDKFEAAALLTRLTSRSCSLMPAPAGFRLPAASHSASVVRHFSSKVSAVRNLPSGPTSSGKHHRAANRLRTSRPRVGGTRSRCLEPPDGWRATGWLQIRDSGWPSRTRHRFIRGSGWERWQINRCARVTIVTGFAGLPPGPSDRPI